MPSKFLTPAVRMGILALVAIAVALSVAAPLRTLVRQSDENAQLASEVADRENHIAELEAELNKWKDPAFVEQQVRDRLHYAKPGEVGYTVLGAPTADSTDHLGQLPAEESGGSWYERLWRSVERSQG
jgi:cell division protein FtsB